MGSPISDTVAEIFLQHLELLNIKHWLETREIIYYNRYVGDVIIIFDTNKTNENTIVYDMNATHHNLDFKPTQKNTNTISYLEITIKRDDNNLAINTHSKPTHTDKAIHTL